MKKLIEILLLFSIAECFAATPGISEVRLL